MLMKSVSDSQTIIKIELESKLTETTNIQTSLLDVTKEFNTIIFVGDADVTN